MINTNEITEKLNQLTEENRLKFVVFLALLKADSDAAKQYIESQEDLQQ